MTLAIDLENVIEHRNNNNFGCELIRLIFKADLSSRAKLREGFPNAVETVEVFKITGNTLDLPYD